MKEKIQEIQKYFADKIARGLYKVDFIDDKYINVTVDRKYTFGLWVGTGCEHFSLCNIGIETFIQFDFTEKQKASAHKKVFIHVKKYRDTELKERELAELKKLQKKYPDAK